jgi:hypothetical protein
MELPIGYQNASGNGKMILLGDDDNGQEELAEN